jgi:hypothetical protein
MQRDSSQPNNRFERIPLGEELQLLLSDNPKFQNTVKYVDLLIEEVLDRFEMTSEQRNELHGRLTLDVTIAAVRYLHNKRDITGAYPFSTYFTWYITDRLERGNVFQKGRS